MRHPHLLRGNKGSRLPVLLMAVDTETDSIPIAEDAVEARLRFGWLAVTRRHRGMRWTPPQWSRFETPDELWDVVERAVKMEWRGYLCAHNAGFDFRVVDGFTQMQRRGWELKGAVIDDPPTILRYHQRGRGLIVLDTLNYYRTRLADIGKMFGLAKLDHDLVWGDRERDDAYCRRDVEIVLAAMQGIIRRTAELDLGNFASTFPGLAFGAFRHRHMDTPILIDDNPDALKLARRAYYGGRTEAFRLGSVKPPITVYDVVSMYPSVMRDEPMPTVLRGVYRSMTVTELAVATTDAAAMADVTLDTDTADYPLLYHDRLVFPVGRFRTVLARPELTHALKRGRIVSLHRCALYEQSVIFRSYIAEWWARRQEAIKAGDLAESDFCKRMMISLYGKFGQSGSVFETLGEASNDDVRTWTEIDMETGEVKRMRSLAGLLQVKSGERESRDSHPAIAATVTSAARIRLLSMMQAFGRERVVYTDTDSLFVIGCNAPAAARRLIGQNLGDLKLERELSSLVLHGLKDYTADGVRKTKGVRATAVEISPDTFKQDMFVGLKGALQDGDMTRQIIRSSVKHLQRHYDKGIVSPSGHITPYRLPIDG